MAHPQQGTTQAARGPQTALRVLEIRRSELNDQLTSLTVRRDLLNQQMHNADDAGQAQLRAQMKDIGDRTAKVMKDLAAVDDAANKLTADATNITVIPANPEPTPIPGVRTTITTLPPAGPPFNTDRAMDRVAVVSSLFIVAVFFTARAWLRRPRFAAASLGDADVGRLEKLQQSVDVIAIEVERIAEAQRFLSKVLGPGPAQEIKPDRERDAIESKRR